MLNFLEAKQDEGLVAVSGCCADSPRFSYLVNSAVRRLMIRGDFLGTVTPIQVCVKNGCVVWNRYIGSIRKLNLCVRGMCGGGMVPVPIRNEWYSFLSPSMFRTEFQSHLGQQPVMFAEGESPTYSGIYGDGRLVRAYPSTLADVGKTVRLFGVDNGNQPLRTDNGDGTWSEGIDIIMAAPYGSTSGYVRRIDRVIKAVTQGQVFLYAYDAANDVLEDLAVYDPGETNPSYERTKLQGPQGGACCSSTRSVVALVKLKFIPVKFDTDLVGIGNLDALKDMFQSIRAKEAGDFQMAEQFEASAVNELNKELENAFPDDTFSAVNNVFAGMNFRNRAF